MSLEIPLMLIGLLLTVVGAHVGSLWLGAVGVAVAWGGFALQGRRHRR